MTTEQGELLNEDSLAVSDIRASAIVVADGADAALWLCLQSLLTQEGLLELLLLDNGLTPDTRTRLEQLAGFHKKMRIIDLPEPDMQQAAARNIGADMAKGRMLLFVSAQAILPPGCLLQMARALDANKQGGIISPRLLDAEGNPLRENRTNLLTPKHFVAELQHKPEDKDAGLGLFLPDASGMKDALAVPSLPPYVWLCSKHLFQEFDGLNGEYGELLAGWDFCLRLRAKGYRLLWLPSITLYWLGNPWDAAWQRRALHGLDHYWKHYFTEPSDAKWVKKARLLPRLRRLMRRRMQQRLKQKARLYDAQRQQLLRKLFLLQEYEQTPAPMLTTAKAFPEMEGEVWLYGEKDHALWLALLRRLLKMNQRLRVLRSTPLPFYDAQLQWTLPGLAAEGQPEYVILLGNNLPDETTLRHWQKLGLRQLLWVTPARWQQEQTLLRQRETATEPSDDTTAVSKQAEREFFGLCERLKIRATIFRHAPTYGLGVGDSLSDLRQHIRTHGWVPLSGQATGRRQPLQVEDAARAILRAIGNRELNGQTLTLAGGEIVSVREMVLRMQEAEQIKPRLLSSRLCRWWRRCHQMQELKALRDAEQDQLLDNHPAQEQLKFSPSLFEPTTIARTYLDALEETA